MMAQLVKIFVIKGDGSVEEREKWFQEIVLWHLQVCGDTDPHRHTHWHTDTHTLSHKHTHRHTSLMHRHAHTQINKQL